MFMKQSYFNSIKIKIMIVFEEGEK